MDIQDIVPVEWQNCRVLLTSQLAEYYECTVKQIKQNFNNNKDRFVAGKHYFKLEGDMLKKFRSDLQVDEIDSQNLQVDEIDSQNLQVENNASLGDCQASKERSNFYGRSNSNFQE